MNDSIAVPEGELRQLAEELHLSFQERLDDPHLPSQSVDGDLDRIVGSWARQSGCVPIGERGDRILVATSNPANIDAFEELRTAFRRPIELVVTPHEELIRAINALRAKLMANREKALSGSSGEEGEENEALKIDVTDGEDEDAPIIRYLNDIIFKASQARASDVHIESFEDAVKVRFRIDGVLYDIDTEDKVFQNAIISRVKVMAGLNIAEKRLPQDGRIGIKVAGREVDLRVSTIPTQFGERVVMRLLDKAGSVLDLRQIGMGTHELDAIEKIIQKPNGIFLVTGPTGSGKTTTLYSCLAKINSPEINILTVEDPIEYQLRGIGQMQVSPKIGFTFASGLRAILRQDPDVIMVGEIRDAETAEIAIQASLTGHLVFSTLHTNDAPGAITRLVDMGIEPFLVSSSLMAVLGQRLVRRLCPECREAYELTDGELVEIGIDPRNHRGSRVAYKTGSMPCERCNGTRFLGRVGIYELLLIDDVIRPLILQRVDAATIRQAAVQRGFRTLRADGAAKILDGSTSVSEVVLATHEDGSVEQAA